MDVAGFFALRDSFLAATWTSGDVAARAIHVAYSVYLRVLCVWELPGSRSRSVAVAAWFFVAIWPLNALFLRNA